ncbi:hypothetical protein ACVIHD_000588 [Bradyrhizobium embrapense]
MLGHLVSARDRGILEGLLDIGEQPLARLVGAGAERPQAAVEQDEVGREDVEVAVDRRIGVLAELFIIRPSSSDGMVTNRVATSRTEVLVSSLR